MSNLPECFVFLNSRRLIISRFVYFRTDIGNKVGDYLHTSGIPGTETINVRMNDHAYVVKVTGQKKNIVVNPFDIQVIYCLYNMYLEPYN